VAGGAEGGVGVKPPKRLFRERRENSTAVVEPPLHPRPFEPEDLKGDRLWPDFTSPVVMQAAGPPFDIGIEVHKHRVCVPVARFVELECDHSLRALESLGVRVDRFKGSSAIDLARCIAASQALKDALDSVLFIDSDIKFDPADAIKLLNSPEPIIAGLYARKQLGQGSAFTFLPPPEIESIKYGEWCDELYPVYGVGAGFMRIKVSALGAIAHRLELPFCRLGDEYGWPFFMPLVVEQDCELRYQTEDYAFCQRAREAGIVPKVDPSIRLYHIGDYPYGAEEASGDYVPRYRNLKCNINRLRPAVDKPSSQES
jgi:hypothetical protein